MIPLITSYIEKGDVSTNAIFVICFPNKKGRFSFLPSLQSKPFPYLLGNRTTALGPFTVLFRFLFWYSVKCNRSIWLFI